MSCVADEMTANEIGRELGRTEKAVVNYAKRNGIEMRPGTRPDVLKRARLVRLLGSGMTLRKAAAETGVCRTTVWRMAKVLVADGILIVEKTGRGLVYRTTPEWGKDAENEKSPTRHSRER